MPRLKEMEMLIGCLEGTYPEGVLGFRTREEALDHLRILTGKDFGFDVAAWGQWLDEVGSEIGNITDKHRREFLDYLSKRYPRTWGQPPTADDSASSP